MAMPQTLATESPQSERVPELRAGDRLTRPEFERRYAAMPHVKKAELIEGVDSSQVMVVLQQRLASPEHAEFVGRLRAAAAPAGPATG
jgi:hypothetical protein